MQYNGVKNFFLRLKSFMISVSILVALNACSDDSMAGFNEIDKPDEATEQPTEDAVAVMVNTKTFVFQNEYTGTGTALVRRLSNTSNSFDETVKAAVIHDNCVSSLSDKNYSDIMTLIARGGCIIYNSATRNNTDAFIRGLKRIGNTMLQSGDLQFTEEGWTAYERIMQISEDSTGLLLPPSLQLHDTNGELCDIYAFKGFDQYVVADLNEPQSIVTVITETGENTNTVSTQNNITISEKDATTDYIRGCHTDALAEWIDAKKDYTAEALRGRMLLHRAANAGSEFMDLDKVCSAHTVRFSFTAYGGHKQAPVTLLYEIWPVNNTSGSDYYLVHQKITVENSKLKCGPEDKEKWSYYRVAEFYGKHREGTKAYHAYMSGVKNEVKFLGAPTILDHASPENTIGTCSFSEGSSWSLSTSFINPNIGGAISMSKSWSYNVSDLKMLYTKSNKNGATEWEYKATSRPQLAIKVHGLCKEIQKNDASFDFCWIWCVENANKQYSFEAKASVEMEGLWNDGYYLGYQNFVTTASRTIELPQPPRYAQEWSMRMEPVKKDVFDELEKKLPNQWKGTKYLYTVTANDTAQINKWIDSVSITIQKNPLIIKDAFNVKETDTVSFTLAWKRIDQYETYKKRYYKL